jgi:hypothetical protein
MPTFRSARLEHLASAFRRHSGTKAMGPGTPDAAGLKSAFHYDLFPVG